MARGLNGRWLVAVGLSLLALLSACDGTVGGSGLGLPDAGGAGGGGGEPTADAGEPDASTPVDGGAGFCEGKADGLFCRDAHTLVRCRQGGLVESSACPAGCEVRPSGTPDRCAVADAGTDGGAGGGCADSAVRSLYGMNIDPANPKGNPTVDELRSARVRWARVEWKVPQGDAFYDPLLTRLRAAGIKVMLIVDYSSEPSSVKPASNASAKDWDNYRLRFRGTMQRLAQHLGNNVDAWQIWNEPDLNAPGTGYDPGVPAEQFGKMLRDASEVIRPSSSRPIVTGGLASGNPGYLSQARAAIGGALPVDAVAVHPYGQRAPDNWPNPTWGFGNMSALFDGYLVFGKPLWVSEIGTPDAPNLAAYLGNVYQLVRTRYAGKVERVFWFCWSDGMVPPYGVLDGAQAKKAAYQSYVQSAPPLDACEGP